MEPDHWEALATADSGEGGGGHTHICGVVLHAIMLNSKTLLIVLLYSGNLRIIAGNYYELEQCSNC